MVCKSSRRFDEREYFPSRTNIRNPQPVSLKQREGVPGLACSHRRKPVMKLHKKLSHLNSLADDFLDHRVFGPFDIHFQNVDSAVPFKLHGGAQPHYRQADGFPAVLFCRVNGVRDPLFTRREMKSGFSVMAGDANGMKMKAWRQS